MQGACCWTHKPGWHDPAGRRRGQQTLSINTVILNRKLPLIVTLKLDAVSFDRLNELRKIHFPPERNLLSAHLSLFHSLPGEELPTICSCLQQICARTVAMPIAFPRVKTLGRGVAIEVTGDELQQLHAHLAKRFCSWLTPQDRQGFRPHVTVQNKVSPQRARELYEALAQDWNMPPGQALGLLLWEYQGGPWLPIKEFPFEKA